MEIETKIIGIDMKSFKKKLKELGAERIYAGKNTTIFLETLHLGKGNMLRLRNFNNKKTELTYKGPKEKSKYKVREEINLLVDDFNSCRRIFSNLGFKEKYPQKNRRESYELTLNGTKYHIDIDHYEGLEPFVEIEAKTEKELEQALAYFNINRDMIFNGSVHELRKISKNSHKNL